MNLPRNFSSPATPPAALELNNLALCNLNLLYLQHTIKLKFSHLLCLIINPCLRLQKGKKVLNLASQKAKLLCRKASQTDFLEKQVFLAYAKLPQELFLAPEIINPRSSSFLCGI
jgi:hypothetical protein